MAKKRTYQDDDGRTIADMSGIEPSPMLFPRTALLGASGIVFMLIMLASLSGFSGGIPVTMLLVAALYLGQQVYDIIFVRDNVANFMHIVGGVCGTVFGYVNAGPRRRRRH